MLTTLEIIMRVQMFVESDFTGFILCHVFGVQYANFGQITNVKNMAI